MQQDIRTFFRRGGVSRNDSSQQKHQSSEDSLNSGEDLEVKFKYQCTHIIRHSLLEIPNYQTRQLSLSSIQELERELAPVQHERHQIQNSFDPYRELSILQRQDAGGTFFNESEIKSCLLKATRLHVISQLEKRGELYDEDQLSEEINSHFNNMETQIAASQVQQQIKDSSIQNKKLFVESSYLSSVLANQKNSSQNKSLLPQIIDLKRDGCCDSSILKRLRLSPYQLRKVLNSQNANYHSAQRSHQEIQRSRRARTAGALEKILTNSSTEFNLGSLQTSLLNLHKIKCSQSFIRGILKKDLKFSFKKIYHLNQRANYTQSLKCRAIASQKYVELLSSGCVIINIDECSIQNTHSQKYSWSRKQQQAYTSLGQRLSQISIIAGISSAGECYYQVNQGRNNSICFVNFVLQLALALQKEDDEWRSKCIFMIDNATYHKSSYVQRKIARHRIPIFYLGPYQFDLAPVEKLFSCLKRSLRITLPELRDGKRKQHF